MNTKQHIYSCCYLIFLFFIVDATNIENNLSTIHKAKTNEMLKTEITGKTPGRIWG